ncbi:MAG: hypothetical protein ACPLY9_06365 [Nitrososphaerales archaeon]
MDDIKSEIEEIDLSGLLTKTYFDSIFTTARLANIDLITTINSKLDDWFGTGGTYEDTIQLIKMAGDSETATTTKTITTDKTAKYSVYVDYTHKGVQSSR